MLTCAHVFRVHGRVGVHHVEVCTRVSTCQGLPGVFTCMWAPPHERPRLRGWVWVLARASCASRPGRVCRRLVKVRNTLVCARARFSPRVRVLPRAAAGQALPTATEDRPWTMAEPEPGPGPGLRHPDPAARMSRLAPPRPVSPSVDRDYS